MRKEKKLNHKYGDYFQRGQNEIYLHTALREMNREASAEVKGEPQSLEISCFGEQKGFLFKQTFFCCRATPSLSQLPGVKLQKTDAHERLIRWRRSTGQLRRICIWRGGTIEALEDPFFAPFINTSLRNSIDKRCRHYENRIRVLQFVTVHLF